MAVVSSVPLSPYEFQNGSAGDVAVEAAAVHSQNRKFTTRNREIQDADDESGRGARRGALKNLVQLQEEKGCLLNTAI